MMIKKMIILLSTLLFTITTVLAVSLPKHGVSDDNMFGTQVYFAGQGNYLLGATNDDGDELADEGDPDVVDPNSGEPGGGEELADEGDPTNVDGDDTPDPGYKEPISDTYIPFILLLSIYGTRKFYLRRKKK
jgi:hypothetical protein